MPEDKIRELLKSFSAGDWWARKEIMKEILANHENLYIDVLEDWLREGDDASLRNAAVEIYTALGPRGLPSLLSLLQDTDPDVRILTINILGEIGDSGAVEELLNALESPDARIRHAAAEALGKRGDKKAVSALAGKTEDEPWVAMAAISALGMIGGEAVLPILHSSLGREEYCGMACIALERAGTVQSIPHLVKCMESEGVKIPALKAMVRICEREKATLPCQYLKGMLPFLISLLDSPEKETRRTALTALGWAGDAAAAPHLIRLLDDESVQEYSVKGLLCLGKKTVPYILAALRRPLQNRVILAKVLSFYGENAELLPFVEDGDAEVRTEAALALSAVEAGAAMRALEKLLQDPVEEVRTAAGLSMKLLKGKNNCS